jgi:hypothetical protein
VDLKLGKNGQKKPILSTELPQLLQTEVKIGESKVIDVRKKANMQQSVDDLQQTRS